MSMKQGSEPRTQGMSADEWAKGTYALLKLGDHVQLPNTTIAVLAAQFRSYCAHETARLTTITGGKCGACGCDLNEFTRLREETARLKAERDHFAEKNSDWARYAEKHMTETRRLREFIWKKLGEAGLEEAQIAAVPIEKTDSPK